MKRGLAVGLISSSILVLLLSVVAVYAARPTLAHGNRPAFGPTLVVGNDADTSGLLCDSPANCTLRSAIEIANHNGTPDWIVFTTGSHLITLTNILPTLVETTTYISGIDSALTPQVVKINANNIAQAFVVNGYDIQLDHLRIYGSGPGASNIWITGASQLVRIFSDTIGTDDPFIGSCSLSPNSYGGIYINATGPLGGAGRAYIYGDYILCHGNAASQGISLYGTDNVVIGADPSNNAGIAEHNHIANNHDGIVIENGAHDNFIHNSDVNANVRRGVWLTGGSHDNVVEGSMIYYNTTGIQIDSGANSNLVGSNSPTTFGNVIGSNGREGIYISGTATSYNAVYGNKIGVAASGVISWPNGHNGVVLDGGAHHNYIGFTISNTNIIAGNGQDGVLIANGSHDNYIQNNDIGLNSSFPVLATANARVSARQSSAPAGPNGGGGSYLRLPNGLDGIVVSGAYSNTIGGYLGSLSADNFIFYNNGSGISITSGSRYNVIGFNTVRGNAHYGVILDGTDTAYNTITRTLIDHNGYDGIGERTSALANVWSEVGIYANGGLGIDKAADNDALNIVDPPYLFFDSINRNTGVVSGHADSTDGIFDITLIELYRVYPNSSGYGDGWSFVGKTFTDAGGHWTIIDPSPAQSGGCYTAFVTEAFPLLVVPYHSSEFSANTCRNFLPMVLKNH